MTVNFDLLALYAQTRSARSLRNTSGNATTGHRAGLPECLPNGLPFYLKRLVTVLTSDGNELTSNYVLFTLHSANPGPRGRAHGALAALARHPPHPVYLLADKNHLTMLNSIALARGVEVVELGSNYWRPYCPRQQGIDMCGICGLVVFEERYKGIRYRNG